jgi:hypothetical protein
MSLVSPAHYSLEEFLEVCRTGQGVIVWASAEEGAEELFELETKEAILFAIASCEVRNRRLLDSEPLRDHPPKGQEIDAYDFDLWSEKVYIAFFKANGTWSLKSFKSQYPVPKFSDQAKRIEAGFNDFQEIRGLH